MRKAPVIQLFVMSSFLAACGTDLNSSRVSDAPEFKPTYVCYDTDLEHKLITVQETADVVGVRPSGARVYSVRIQLGQRTLIGKGNVSSAEIDVSAIDAIAGDIALQARPGDARHQFNALSMLGDVKSVACFERRNGSGLEN